MHDEDALHPNRSLQEKLQHIYTLRRSEHPKGRVNFEDNTHYRALLQAFGNPQLSLPPVIHVAGTNGKGSTLAFLRAIFEAAGLRVHAYTSPHLRSFNERIYLAGALIDDHALEALIDEAFANNEDAPVTFFEFTTALAFAAFTCTPADIVLLETGMGGRLDCTNVVPKPAVTAITQIGWDHMDFLGVTLADIAAEKAGIMKRGAPCIIGPQTEEARTSGVLEIFKKHTEELDIKLIITDEGDTYTQTKTGFSFRGRPYPVPGLAGAHQIENAITALSVIDALRGMFPITAADKTAGLAHVKWPGRLEKLTDGKLFAAAPEGAEVWFDGGHNKEAAMALAATFRAWRNNGSKVHVILCMKAGKDITTVRDILAPLSDSLRIADTPEELPKLVHSTELMPQKGNIITICGSFYNYL